MFGVVRINKRPCSRDDQKRAADLVKRDFSADQPIHMGRLCVFKQIEVHTFNLLLMHSAEQFVGWKDRG